MRRRLHGLRPKTRRGPQPTPLGRASRARDATFQAPMSLVMEKSQSFTCVVVASLILASCASSLVETLPVSSAASCAPGAYETATARYDDLPWTFTIERALAIAVRPLSAAPSAPAAYREAGYSDFAWAGGASAAAVAGGVIGHVVVLAFSDSPIGRYSELFYLPGKYAAPCGDQRPRYFSVQRIWVDSERSRHAGRTIWGMPKELADFEWAQGDEAASPGRRWTSVELREPGSRRLIFRANVTDLGPAPQVPLPAWLLPARERTVLQWPLPAPEQHSLHVNGSDGLAAERAASPVVPSLTELSFSARGLLVGRIAGLHVDSAAFTGNASAGVHAFPLAARFAPGSCALLSSPVPVPGC